MAKETKANRTGTRVRSPKQISEIMRRVRSSATTPERVFGRALKRLGIRARRNAAPLPGKPDFVVEERKIAVFLDGDFWHGGQWVRRKLANLEAQFKHAKSKQYWLRKIRRNVARDSATTSRLLENGWTVLRFWESDIEKDLGECLEMTQKTVLRGARTNGLSSLPDRTVAEFFAGIGLVRMGLEREGWQTRFANDNDPDKFEMYNANFPEASQTFRLCDIGSLSAKDIPRIQGFHGRQRLRIHYDSSKTTWQAISDLLTLAREHGKDGAVAQYLVGAKLELRFPAESIENKSFSTADQQLGRHGDYQVSETCFHVTVAPTQAHYEKCRKNVEDGLRSYFLVPDRLLMATRQNLGLVAPGRVAVESIESFVSQNVEELSVFSKQKIAGEFHQLLQIYNRRVEAVEIDKSLLIEIPAGLK